MPTHIRAKANGFNHLIAIFAGLGSFTYGFNLVAIGSVIGLSSFSEYFHFTLTDSFGSAITGASIGIFTAGGLIGCLSVNWLCDKLGRKRGIQIMAAVCSASAILQTASVHIAMFLIGRFINGLGCGMLNCIIPIYLSEISPPLQRGRLVGYHGVMTCFGYGSAGWVGLGTYFEYNPQIQWRLFIGFQVAAPMLLCLGSPMLPESPRWLISMDRNDEGMTILKTLHKDPSDSTHIGARQEFDEIQQQIILEREDPVGNIFQFMFNRQYRKRIFMGFFLQSVDQMTGVLVISNYMVVELGKLGVAGYEPLLILGFYNTWAALLNLLNALVVDRTGRIRTIVTGISAGLVCIIIVTALVANYETTDNANKAGAGAAIAFMFLFVTSYGSCVDASTYIYCSEIFPTKVRALGVGISTSAVFLLNTIILTVAGTAFENIGWKFYIVFITVPAAALPYILWFYPETKALSLEQIGALFGDKLASDAVQMSGSKEDNTESVATVNHID